MSNEGYHEPVDKLSEETMDKHRAIISLMEELEAVDWYQQRVDATTDPELKAILEHNRDEEIEHAIETINQGSLGFSASELVGSKAQASSALKLCRPFEDPVRSGTGQVRAIGHPVPLTV